MADQQRGYIPKAVTQREIEAGFLAVYRILGAPTTSSLPSMTLEDFNDKITDANVPGGGNKLTTQYRLVAVDSTGSLTEVATLTTDADGRLIAQSPASDGVGIQLRDKPGPFGAFGTLQFTNVTGSSEWGSLKGSVAGMELGAAAGKSVQVVIDGNIGLKFTTAGGVAINHSGVDADTVIRGLNDEDLFYVDAGNDAVLIGYTLATPFAHPTPFANEKFGVKGDVYFAGNLIITGTVDGRDVATDGTKLDGIEALAEVNNISDADATALTDGGETSLHTHPSTGSGDVVGPTSAVDGNIAMFDGTTGKLIADSLYSQLALGLSIAHYPLTTNPHAVTKAQVGLGDVANTLHNLTATTAPTVGDDDADGYSIGSVWWDITNDKVYGCTDATTGVAIWVGLNNISDLNAEDLTNGNGSTLHYHTSDRARANHTGTQDMDTLTETATKKVMTSTERTNLGNQSGTNTGDEVAASETVAGVAELATQAEVDAGTDDTRIITPKKLAAWPGGDGPQIKAWVRFNGDTLTIDRSYNVSSLTDIGNGRWRVNLTNAVSLNACCLVGGKDIDDEGVNNFRQINCRQTSTTGFYVGSAYGDTEQDAAVIYMTIIE